MNSSLTFTEPNLLLVLSDIPRKDGVIQASASLCEIFQVRHGRLYGSRELGAGSEERSTVSEERLAFTFLHK